MRKTSVMPRKIRRLLSAAALLPLLGWAVMPAAAAAPMLCEAVPEREPAHACCPPAGGQGGAHEHPGKSATVHKGVATHASDEVDSAADCSCHPAPDTNGADDSHPAVSLDGPSPRIEFPGAFICASWFTAGADGTQRTHGPPYDLSAGSPRIPLFLLNEILLI